jgi:hypothetical protein
MNLQFNASTIMLLKFEQLEHRIKGKSYLLNIQYAMQH